jgi:hypothetical protein
MSSHAGSHVTVSIRPDYEALCRAAAELFVKLANKGVKESGRFSFGEEDKKCRKDSLSERRAHKPFAHQSLRRANPDDAFT